MRALLLRSPLHRLVPRGWLLLTVDDDRVAQRYAEDDGDLVVLAAEGDDWWQDMARDTPVPVQVHLHGRPLEATARFASGEDLDRAMIAFLHAHPGTWRALGVAPDASEEEVGAAARRWAALIITPTSG